MKEFSKNEKGQMEGGKKDNKKSNNEREKNINKEGR